MQRFIATFAVFLLSACATDTTSRGGPEPVGSAPPTGPAVGTRVERPVEPSFRPPVPTPRPRREAANPPPTIDPEALAGVDREGLRAILGPADVVRDQPPGTVWIYRDTKCTVEFYLFPQISGTGFAVLGHKILPGTLSEGERASCLTHLASRTRSS